MRTLFCICIAVLLSLIVSAEDLSLRDADSAEQFLVLNNGRVVDGKLTLRTGGYDVALSAGRMFISNEQVRFRAASMNDAYLRMRGSVQNLTPTTHLELARWCLTNKLPSQAQRELLDALHLDPDFADARLMLEGLVRDERRSRQAVKAQANSERSQAVIDELAAGGKLPERRSLGGMPRPMAQTFTRNIQPLLSNKCGNARCHSAGRNSFVLISVRNGSSAVIAEQNLASILNQLNFQDAAQSPLWTATTGLHGGSRQLLFPGQTGRRQLTVLRHWIDDVIRELGAEESARQPPPSAADASGRMPAVSQTAFLSNDAEPTTSGDAALVSTTHATERSTTETDPKFLKEAVIATRHDEFDPDVFNRRFHGRSTARDQPSD